MIYYKKLISQRTSVSKPDIKTISFVHTDQRDSSNRFPVLVGIYPADLVMAGIRWPGDIERRVQTVPFHYSFTDGRLFDPKIFVNANRNLRETKMVELAGGHIDSIVAVSDLNDYPLTDGVWLMEKRDGIYHVLAVPPGTSQKFEVGGEVREYDVSPHDLSMFTGKSYMMGVTQEGEIVFRRVTITGTDYSNLQLTIDNNDGSIIAGAKVKPIILDGKTIDFLKPEEYLGARALISDMPHQQIFRETCPGINHALKRLFTSPDPLRAPGLIHQSQILVSGLSNSDIQRLKEKSTYEERQNANEVTRIPGTFYVNHNEGNEVWIHLKRQRFAWTIFVTGYRKSDGRKEYMIIKMYYDEGKTVGLYLEEAAHFVLDIARNRGIKVENAAIGAAGGDVRLLVPQGDDLVRVNPKVPKGMEIKPGFDGLSNTLVLRHR